MSRGVGFSKSISGFDPRSIAGCCLWLDGADSNTINSGVSITNGTQVTTWKDKSIFLNHATPVSNATIPVYWNTNTIGGLPAIYMCNAPQFRGAFSTRLTGSNISVFTVAYTSATMPNALGHDQRLVSLTSNNTTSTDYLDSTGFLPLDNQYTFSNLTSYYNNSQVTNYSNLVTSNVFLASVVAGNAVVNVWYNGLLFPTTGGIGPATNALNIGNYGVGGGSYPTAEAWYGGIGEVLIYSNALSTSERQAVEGYLSWKWSIEVGGSSPQSVPGLILWLDGNDSSSISFSSGTTVSQWNDKSGFGNHATTNVTPAANTLTGPSYNSTTKAMLFTAANTTGLRGNIAITYSNTATVFVVATYISNVVAPANPRLFVLGSNTSSEIDFVGQLSVIQQNASGGFITDYFQTTTAPGYNSSTGAGGNYQTSIPISYSTPFIYSSRSVITVAGSGISVNTFVNGSNSTYSTASGTSVSAPANYTSNYNRYSVGNVLYYNGGPNSDSYNGNVYEVLVYSNALTISQINSINAYLSKKWKISVATTIGLPVNHSFYNIQPFIRQFSPYDIGIPLFWWDAADTKTITGTSTVTAWLNKGSWSGSATSYSGTVVSGSTQYNGLNVVVFPTNGELRFTAAIPLQPRAWFAVFKQTTQVTVSGPNFTQYFAIINQTQGSGQDAVAGPLVPTTQGTTSYVLSEGPSGNPNGVQTANIVPDGYNVMKQYGWINSAVSTASNFQTVNGIDYLAGQSPSANNTATAYRTDSVTYSINTSWYNNSCHCAEILMFNTEITTSQKQQIEGYLAWKWGLSSLLVTAHPYKKFPPSSAIPFLPTNFSGCVLWLDGNDPLGTGLIPKNNATITAWIDKSSRNNSSTVTGTLTYQSSFANNNGSIKFSGTQYIQNTTFTLALSVKTFFMVCSSYAATANGSPAGYIYFGNVGNVYDQQTGTAYQGPETGFNNKFGFLQGYGNGGYYTSVTTAGETPLGIYGDTQNSTTASLYVNGSNLATNTLSYTPGLATGFRIGKRSDNLGASAYNLYGNICEIIVYNVLLSTAQRQKVEGYLASKWGLTSSLPSTHPYKLYEPAQEGFLIVAAPGTPTALVATNTTSTLNMSWTTGSGGTPATFTVTVYAVATSTLVSTQTISYPTTSATFSPMTSTVGYAFYVSATNTGGTSAIAGPSSTVTYTASATTLITTVGAGNVVFGAGGATIIIECWGAGGGSMGGDSYTGAGAGGAYAKTTLTGLSAGFTLYYSVGAGGTGSSASASAGAPTWARITTNAQPTVNTQGALAVGGAGSGFAGPNNSAQSANSIGTVIYSGGAGGYNGPENGGGGSASSGGNGSSATGGQGTAGGASGTGGGAGGSAGGTANSGGDGISNVEGGGGGGGSYNNQGGNGGLPGGAGGMGWSSGGAATSGVNTNSHGYGGDGGRGQIRYART
jgi:hypothetical protein